MVRILFVLLFIVLGCQRQYKDQPTENNISKETVINANKAMVQEEARQIDDFIKRHHFKMETSSTGLRYFLYQRGFGKFPTGSSTVVISYRVYLLDGTLCYNVEETKPMTVRLGAGDQIRGLEEGLMMMNKLSRARFIIPDHLAYGLTGDGNKIPPVSALYFDVLMKEIK